MSEDNQPEQQFKLYHSITEIETCWLCQKPIEDYKDKVICSIVKKGFYPLHRACTLKYDEQMVRYLAEVRRDALLEAAKVERERIVKIVQGLLYEAESDAIGKPEYYDDVNLYKGIIDLIAADQGQGQGKE